MSHATSRTGFTRTDLLAALVITGLTLIYGIAMIGCDGGGGDRAATSKAIEDLTKKTDDLTRRVEAMEPTVQFVEGKLKEQTGQRTELKSARTTSRRMQNGTQVRGINQGMILYAQSNKTFYPGFESNGENRAAQQGSAGAVFGAAAFDDANPTAMVYAVMMSGSYFTPEYAISPFESTKTKAKAGATPVTSANYSYALLKVTNKASDKGRRTEWSDTQNSQAPVASDRSKAIDPALNTTSLHVDTTSTDSAAWQGSVVWNDNHVTFETTGNQPADHIKIGRSLGERGAIDDLFSGAPVAGLDATTNALFAY